MRRKDGIAADQKLLCKITPWARLHSSSWKHMFPISSVGLGKERPQTPLHHDCVTCGVKCYFVRRGVWTSLRWTRDTTFICIVSKWVGCLSLEITKIRPLPARTHRRIKQLESPTKRSGDGRGYAREDVASATQGEDGRQKSSGCLQEPGRPTKTKIPPVKCVIPSLW